MKKLLALTAFYIPLFLIAPKAGAVNIAVTIKDGTLQPGTTAGFNVSSGTAQNLRFVHAVSTGDLSVTTIISSLTVNGGGASDSLGAECTSGTEGTGFVIKNHNVGGYGAGLKLYSKTNYGGNFDVPAGQLQNVGADTWASSGTVSSNIQLKTVYQSTMTIVIDGAGSGVKIVGTNKADNAPAGDYGEYISSSCVSNVTITGSANYFDVCNQATVVLTAGDWDVNGTCYFTRNGATYSGTGVECGIGTASGTSASGVTLGDTDSNQDSNTSTSWTSQALVTPIVRKSISATTTFFLKGYPGTFTGSPLCRGRISARRIR